MGLQRLKDEVAGLDGRDFFQVVKAWVAAHHDAPDGTLEDLMRAGTAFAARHWGECETLTVVGYITTDEPITFPVICRPSAS